MIYVLRNGHDDASLYTNRFDSTFTDINDSWSKVILSIARLIILFAAGRPQILPECVSNDG